MKIDLAVVQIGSDTDRDGGECVNQDEDRPGKDLVIKALTSVVPLTATIGSIELHSSTTRIKRLLPTELCNWSALWLTQIH